MWQPNAQCASERDFVLGQCEETSSAPERPDPNFKVRYSEQLEWSGTGDDVCGYLDDRRGPYATLLVTDIDPNNC